MLRSSSAASANVLAPLALFAALCSAPAAQAQHAVLYGLIDVSGSRTRPVGGDSRWQLDNGNLTRSYLGFRGTEDLGGGLRAVFRLETYVRADTGQSGRTDTDGFWSRDSYVGLQGAFGTTVLGRTVSPLYAATIAFNPFGEGFGFSPATRQYYGARGAILGDRSWNNSINYNNDPRDPLRLNLAANVSERTGGSLSTGRNYGGSVAYITGPFAATVAAEYIGNSPLALPGGFERQRAVQAGATYDLKFVRVYGQYGIVKTDAADDVKTTLWQVGAAVPLGTGLVLAAYGRSHQKSDLLGSTDRQASLGYDYFLSKNTDIYVAALYEKLSFTSPYGRSIAGGVRHRF